MHAQRLARRFAGRGESGFALMVTLGIIGLLSLTVVALLSQTAVANNITLTQRIEARTNRAAEAAIETATNILRMQTESDIEGDADPCDALGSTVPGPKLTTEVDGVTVDVYCTNRPPSGEFPTLLNEGSDVGRTRLVGAAGDTPARNYPTRADPSGRLAGWDVNCTGTPAATDGSCLPWALAIPAIWGPSGYGASYTQGQIDAINPNLVHVGPGALQFGGDVEVRSGVAAARNPADGAGPAINVGGQYRQGTAGPFNSAFGQPGQCGFIAPAWGTLTTPEPWKARVPDVAVNDLDGEPSCNDADAQKLRDVPGSGTTDASLAAPAVWNTLAFSRPRFMDSLDGVKIPTCSGTLTEVQPGIYNAAAMTALNALIASCGSPIRFVPGDYWFDTDLIVSNANALLVFGTQLNPPTTAADFPMACDETRPGVTITLRERATIRHTAGRVAICNRNSGSDTAIYQAAQTPTEWVPTNSAVASATSWSGIDGGTGSWATAPTVTNLANADGTRARWTNSCSGSIIVDCRGKAGVVTTLPTGAPSPTAGLPSFNVKVLADSNDLRTGYDWLGQFTINRTNQLPGVRVTATKAGGGTCTRHYLGLPNWSSSDVTLGYDLLANGANALENAAAANCRSVFATQGDMNGATVRVDFLFRAEFIELNPINWFGASNRSYELTVDQVRTEAPWVSDARDAGSGASAALSRGGGAVAKTYECSAFSCGGTPELYFSTSNFSQSNAGYLPTHGVPRSVGVEVTGSNRFANKSGTSFTRVRLDLPGGANCEASVPELPSWGQTLYIELLSPGGGGACAGKINDILDLTRSTVTTTLRMACSSGDFLRGCRRILGVGSISAEVDHVRMVATTTPDNSRRGPIRVTVDDKPTGGSSWWVEGDVSVPRRDLEIDWKGNAYEEPLFRGSLVLNGLASAATSATSQVGTVCCTTVKPGQRYVSLHAVVAGNLKARSMVTISDINSAGDTYAPGTDVTVRSYGICRTPVTSTDPDDIDELVCESV